MGWHGIPRCLYWVCEMASTNPSGLTPAFVRCNVIRRALQTYQGIRNCPGCTKGKAGWALNILASTKSVRTLEFLFGIFSAPRSSTAEIWSSNLLLSTCNVRSLLKRCTRGKDKDGILPSLSMVQAAQIYALCCTNISSMLLQLA